MSKTYTNAELNALVAEFSAEFDQLVKAEVAKGGQSLRKSDDEKSSGSDDKGGPPSDSGSDGGSDSAPAASAPAESAPPAASADPAASASAAPADPAASAAPADPAASAGSDPAMALKAAYAQLSPEELQQHFLALKEVLMAQAAGAGPADPAASAGGAPVDPAASAGGMPPADPMASAGAPPADPMASAGAPPAGPGAIAPLAGEGSKPVDPAATMALKSEFDQKLNLVKSERDAATAKIAELQKSVEMLTEAMTKAFSAPVRKGFTAKDLVKNETPAKPDVSQLTKTEITKRLLTKARDPKLQKSDRDLINNFYKGAVKVDALAHLLG